MAKRSEKVLLLIAIFTVWGLCRLHAPVAAVALPRPASVDGTSAAALLGVNYTRFVPRAGAPSCEVLRHTFKFAPQCGDDASSQNIGKVIMRPLLVTGVGRAGTLFARDSMCNSGYHIAHDEEPMGSDGAASWPLAIREGVKLDRRAHNTGGYAMPSFARNVLPSQFYGPHATRRFRTVVHQVRSPLSCIVSRANRVGMMFAPISYSNPHLFREALGYAPSFPQF